MANATDFQIPKLASPEDSQSQDYSVSTESPSKLNPQEQAAYDQLVELYNSGETSQAGELSGNGMTLEREETDFDLWKEDDGDNGKIELEPSLELDEIPVVDTKRFNDQIAAHSDAMARAVSSEYTPKMEVNSLEILTYTIQAGKAIKTERTISVNAQDPTFIDALRTKPKNGWSL